MQPTKLPVEVSARFMEDGNIDPQGFVWKDLSYRIDSTGRRWQDQDGLHILVMIPSQQVFELLFAPHESRWYLTQIPPGVQTA